jgi:hypothetical protein
LLIFLQLAILLVISPISNSSTAASGCSVEGDASPDWGVDVEQYSLTQERNWYDGEGDSIELESLEMSRSNSGRLAPLQSGFHTAVNVANDSSTALRINLTTGYRYTFCIQFHPSNSSAISEPPKGDVYLMESFDWDRYRQMDYWTRGSSDREFLKQTPPEWSGTIMWMPFRDVHAYESLTNTEFSVSLDNAGPTWSLFGDTGPPSFYLVFDGWDNWRSGDADASGRNFTAEVTVMVEERISLPNATAYLVCCSLPLAVAAAPFAVHWRYTKGGEKVEETVQLMPMLDSTRGATTPRDMLANQSESAPLNPDFAPQNQVQAPTLPTETHSILSAETLENPSPQTLDNSPPENL